jgi:hypothetical protein
VVTFTGIKVVGSWDKVLTLLQYMTHLKRLAHYTTIYIQYLHITKINIHSTPAFRIDQTNSPFVCLKPISYPCLTSLFLPFSAVRSLGVIRLATMVRRSPVVRGAMIGLISASGVWISNRWLLFDSLRWLLNSPTVYPSRLPNEEWCTSTLP